MNSINALRQNKMNLKRVCLMMIVACVLFGNITYVTKAQTPRREVSFTIDDLPMAVDARNVTEMRTVTKKLLAPLVKNRVPAIGFVNEGKLYVKGEIDARIDILRMWLDAGMTLGNHTFSHADLNKSSLVKYEDEVIHGEVVTRGLMRERGFNKFYFRYPYNHTGATKEAKESFQAFLKTRGYEIAPFTIEHSDYLFSDAYNKALQKKDAVLTARIRAAYLEYLDTMFGYFEGRSQKLLGREVKQIFLIHVNRINVDCMDEMIQKLKSRGYLFIALDEALQDKAYQMKDEYVGNFGISWLHRWMIGMGQNWITATSRTRRSLFRI